MGIYHFMEHVGTVGGNIPFMRRLYNRLCSAIPPDVEKSLHLQHVGTAGNLLPLMRAGWECCDAFCPDGEEDCYVQADKWPFGPGPGISRVIYAYIDDFINCTSARGKRVKLVYDDIDGKWYSDTPILLRNGSLDLEFEALGYNFITEQYDFELTWVCGGTGFTILQETIQCEQPLRIRFFDLVMQECCACWGAGGDPADPATDEPPQVGVTIVANCIPYMFMQHVGPLVGPAEGPKYPLMKKESPCSFDQNHPEVCNTCGIVAEITDITGTSTMEGTFPLDWNIGFGDDKWHARDWLVDPTYGFPPGGGTGLIEVSCEKRPYNSSLHEHEFRFTVRVMCSTGTGQDQTDYVDVPASEVEDLDTFVDLTFPPITETEPGVFEPNCINNNTTTNTVIRVRLIRP